MNRQKRMMGVVGVLIGTFYAATAAAAPVTTAFTYQGNLLELGEHVNGSADFEFTLWDALVAGNQVGVVVSVNAVSVAQGQFSVEVDFGVDPYTTNQALWLEIHVRSPAGQGQFETLAPRQELTPTPFSLATRGLNVDADGDVGIGATNPQAKLHIGGTPGVDGIMFPDGTLQTSAGGGGNTLDQAYDQGGPGAGRIITADSGSIRINGDGLLLDGPFNSSSHSLNIYAITEGDAVHAQNDGTGYAGFFFSNGPGIKVESINGRAGEFQIPPGINDEAAVYAETRGTGIAGRFVFNNTTTAGAGIFASSNGTTGSSAVSGSGSGSAHGLAATVFGSGRGVLSQVFPPGTSNAGYFIIRNSNSSASALYCETQGTGRAGYFRIDNADSDAAALVCTTFGTGLSLHVARGADAEPEGGGYMVIGFTSGGNLVFDNNEIMARNDGQTSTLFLNNDGGDVRIGQGSGATSTTVYVPVLAITGADLAEKFPVSDEPKPGMVVEIDPDRTGTLRIARGGAYNSRVAGVVSGANDLSVGVVLGNLPGLEDAPPIALSGRVWVQCDASTGTIKPGDLLTTSDTPGHAMKATDRARAYGATIGKAMSSLKEGQGMVLVLVSLQ